MSTSGPASRDRDDERDGGGDRGPSGRRLDLAVLGSGHGSNFEAILAAIDGGALDARVTMVISDQPGARLLDVARGAGLEAVALREHPYSESELVANLQRVPVDLVVLAGYMRIIRRPMLEAYPARILNVHPSLLPAYPGLHAWKQALDAGESQAGCTVHVVDAGVDSGPILGQATIPIVKGDDADSLHARIQVEEHRLYPRVIADYGAKLVTRFD